MSRQTLTAPEGRTVRYAVIVTRVLLGLIFVFFGSNIILHFLPMQPMAGNAGLFMAAIGTTGWMKVIALLQIVGGILLLVGRFVPLGLSLLAPVVFNILLFHIFLQPSGIPVAAVVALLEAFLLVVYRGSFAGIFAADPTALPTVR